MLPLVYVFGCFLQSSGTVYHQVGAPVSGGHGSVTVQPSLYGAWGPWHLCWPVCSSELGIPSLPEDQRSQVFSVRAQRVGGGRGT